MPAAPSAVATPSRWADARLDVLAFALGLALAWRFGWNTTDLVWSLWLSSLCVGYALILWLQSEPLREAIAGMQADRSGVADVDAKVGALLVLSAMTLFGVAFFTVHFGGFHVVHSIFLNVFFPVLGERPKDLIQLAVYREVAVRYWWFVPVALLAERGAFRRSQRDGDTSVTPAAIAARKAKGDVMMLPYKNVLRMHVLIFFFAFAHFLRLEHFLVYAVVYAVYFFPWRLLRRPPA